MRPSPGLLLFTTLLLISILLSAAAIARSTRPASFFFSSSSPFNATIPPFQPQDGHEQEHKQGPLKSQQEEQPTPPSEHKYFHEPGETEALSHYDARFFRTALPYGAHRTTLRHLIRSYLTTTHNLGIETWLAHGTLLGWWWNGHSLPWDYDVDAQVSGETLRGLVEGGLNGSLHTYRYYTDRDGTEEVKEKQYLLDINPHWATVGRAQGMNVIDARWIDVETGMFVDITGLTEREPEAWPGVVMCKNFHGYRHGDLYPLRESEFEGVPALVPYEFENILVAEYGAKSLVVTEWEGHRWEPEMNEWVRINETEYEEVV